MRTFILGYYTIIISLPLDFFCRIQPGYLPNAESYREGDEQGDTQEEAKIESHPMPEEHCVQGTKLPQQEFNQRKSPHSRHRQ